MDWAVSTGMTLHDGVSATFKRMAYGADHFGNAADHAFKKASHSSSRFGDIVKGVLTADLLKSGARALWDIGVSSIKLASDLTEVQNVVDTTFKADAGAINSWSKSAITAFGLSELQAKQMTGSLGAMLKSSGLSSKSLVGMSTNLVGLAGDFASFYNLNIDEAFQKIRSGISGETEPLKQLGINMSVANLQAFALTQGIHKQWKAMTQAEQVQLRYNYLMQVSKDAQGDFAKTLSSSFANQQRVLTTKLQQAGATIMTGLLPLLIQVADKMNNLIDSVDFTKISEQVKSAIPYIVGIASAIGTLFYWIYVLRAPLTAVTVGFIAFKTIMLGMTIVQSAIAAFTFLQAAVTGAGGAMALFNAVLYANPIVWIIALIAALIGIVVASIIYWDQLSSAVSGAFKAVKGFLGIQDQVAKATPKVKVSNDTVAAATKNISDTTSPGGAMGMPSISGGGVPQIPSRAQIAAPTPESMTQKMKLEFYGRIDVVGLPEGSKFTRTGGNAPAIDVKMLGENK